MSELKGACIFGQSGGPTSVINASAYGVIATALKNPSITRVLGAEHGIKGVLNDRLFDMGQEDPAQLDLLQYTPSSALGSCRYKLADPDVDDTDYKRILEIFQKYNVRYFFYNGGNDSMDTIKKLSDYAIVKGHGQKFLGVPKTIDNDIAITDHTPGYGSAARYIAATTAEVGVDVKSLPIHVCVIEAMGRNAGWITAASALARKNPGDAPHLIYLPEFPFNEEEFLEDVKTLYDKLGGVVVVASEGLKNEKGEPIVPPIFKSGRATYYGDVSAHLANLVIKKLGIKARSEKPGICGRASIAWQSPVDRDEAVLAGREALKAAMNGESGVMIGFIRDETEDGSYKIHVERIPIEQVMLYERVIPESYVNERRNDVTEEFVNWCRPLIGPELRDFIDFNDYYKEDDKE